MSSNYLDSFKVSVPEGRSGPWAVERFTIDPDDPAMQLENLRLSFQPGGARRQLLPGGYTRLVHDKRGVVMSDTPAEIKEHWDILIRLATHSSPGKNTRFPVPQSLLINGLGLGVVLKAAVDNPLVQSIDVVEIDEYVLRLVAPHYNSPKVTFHHDDAYTIQWPKRKRWNAVWNDIWDDICLDNLSLMAKLHRRYARRCDWYGSWSHAELKDIQQRERRAGWIY